MSARLAWPSLYLVTPEPPEGLAFDHFVAQLERALQAGVRLVQLRAKTLDERQYAQLAVAALAACRRHGARLLLNASPELTQALNADGVHLTSTRLMACTQRPLQDGMLVSAACHDAHQVLHAKRIGVDLLTISPVLPTQTHPDAIPLGWPRFAELAALAQLPVYALGGMTEQQLPLARAAGATGIAAIRALWGRAL